MKRPASSSAAPRGAKRKATDTIKSKVDTVLQVMYGAEGFPPKSLVMIQHAVPHALSVFKDTRHFTHVEVIKMAKEVVQSVMAKKEAALGEAQASLAEAESTQAAKDAAVEEVKSVAAAKAEAASAAKFALSEAAGSEAAAQAALNDAEAAKKVVVSELEAQQAVKLAHEDALNGNFLPIKAGTSETAEAMIQHLLAFMKTEGFDAQLLVSAPPAMQKAAAERGLFDAIVLGQVEDELNTRIAPLAAKVAALESELNADHQPKVQRCVDAFDAAKAAFAARQSDHAAALEAEKEARAAIKAAEAEAKACRPAVKNMTASNNDAAAAVAEVQEAFKVFEELEHRVPVVEEKPEEAEVPAAEASAEVPAAEASAEVPAAEAS